MDASNEVSNYQFAVKQQLDAGRPEVAAAFYIATVCYPFDQASTDKYWKAQRALWAKDLRERKNEYVDRVARQMPSRAMRSTLHKTSRELLRRLLVSVEIAAPVFLQHISERIESHASQRGQRSGIRIAGAPSVSAATKRIAKQKAKHKAPEQQEFDRENLRQRRWKPTQPVLHLAYAMYLNVDWMPHQRAKQLLLQYLILDPSWVAPALSASNRLADEFVRANLVESLDSLVVLTD